MIFQLISFSVLSVALPCTRNLYFCFKTENARTKVHLFRVERSFRVSGRKAFSEFGWFNKQMCSRVNMQLR